MSTNVLASFRVLPDAFTPIPSNKSDSIVCIVLSTEGRIGILTKIEREFENLISVWKIMAHWQNPGLTSGAKTPLTVGIWTMRRFADS